MSWYAFAFIAPFLWAINNHIDKYVLSKYLKASNTAVLAVFIATVGFLFSIVVGLIFPSEVVHIKLWEAAIIMFNGILFIVAYIPYFFALNNNDASEVVPLYQTIPIFSFIAGYYVFGEVITAMQVAAGVLIILGAVLMLVDITHRHVGFKWRTLWLMLLSSFLLALHFLIFKLMALQGSFVQTAFWEYLGAALTGLFLIFIPSIRQGFVAVIKHNSWTIISINIINEVVNIAGKLCANYATLLAPVVLVSLANGLQPFFVFVLGVGITLCLPFLGKENMTRAILTQRILAIGILFVGTYLLVLK